MLDSDLALNKSFEAQIQEARRKAELFSSSLLEARQKEARALESLEKERVSWTTAFERQSSAFEQLERELTSTVDALQQERTLKDSFEKKLHEVFSISATKDPFAVNRQLFQPPVPDADPISSLPIPPQAPSRAPPTIPDVLSNQNSNNNINFSSTNNNNNPAASPSLKFESDERNSTLYELLRRTQEENKRLHQEIASRRTEFDEAKRQCLQSSQQLQTLLSTKDQLLTSLKETDDKLQFRIKQVLEFEQEKNGLLSRETELQKIIISHETQIKLLKTELSVSNSELRSALSRSSQLEQELSSINQSEKSILQSSKVLTLEATITNLEQQLEDAHNKYDAERKLANDSYANLKRQYDALDATLEEVKDQYSQLNQDHNQLIGDIASLKTQFQEAQTNSNQELNDWKLRYDILLKQEEDQRMLCDEQKQQYAILQARFSELQHALNSLQRDFDRQSHEHIQSLNHSTSQPLRNKVSTQDVFLQEPIQFQNNPSVRLSPALYEPPRHSNLGERFIEQNDDFNHGHRGYASQNILRSSISDIQSEGELEEDSKKARVVENESLVFDSRIKKSSKQATKLKPTQHPEPTHDTSSKKLNSHAPIDGNRSSRLSTQKKKETGSFQIIQSSSKRKPSLTRTEFIDTTNLVPKGAWDTKSARESVNLHEESSRSQSRKLSSGRFKSYMKGTESSQNHHNPASEQNKGGLTNISNASPAPSTSSGKVRKSLEAETSIGLQSIDQHSAKAKATLISQRRASDSHSTKEITKSPTRIKKVINMRIPSVRGFDDDDKSINSHDSASTSLHSIDDFVHVPKTKKTPKKSKGSANKSDEHIHTRSHSVDPPSRSNGLSKSTVRRSADSSFIKSSQSNNKGKA